MDYQAIFMPHSTTAGDLTCSTNSANWVAGAASPAPPISAPDAGFPGVPNGQLVVLRPFPVPCLDLLPQTARWPPCTGAPPSSMTSPPAISAARSHFSVYPQPRSFPQPDTEFTINSQELNHFDLALFETCVQNWMPLPDRLSALASGAINGLSSGQDILPVPSVPFALPVLPPAHTSQSTNMVLPPYQVYPLAAAGPLPIEHTTWQNEHIPAKSMSTDLDVRLAQANLATEETRRRAQCSTADPVVSIVPSSERDLLSSSLQVSNSPISMAAARSPRISYAQAATAQMPQAPAGPPHMVPFARRSPALSVCEFDESRTHVQI